MCADVPRSSRSPHSGTHSFIQYASSNASFTKGSSSTAASASPGSSVSNVISPPVRSAKGRTAATCRQGNVVRSGLASNLAARRAVARESGVRSSFAHTVVLVEGISDQLALEALAERRGRNLDAEGISIVPMGGSKNIGRFLDLFGPQGFNVRLAGLCDAAEEGDFKRGLERAGLGSNLTRADMESLGFYVCVADLEDELIRSLGADAVEQVVDAQGDLETEGWKIQSAALLVDALDLTQVPRPLDRVLAYVGALA